MKILHVARYFDPYYMGQSKDSDQSIMETIESDLPLYTAITDEHIAGLRMEMASYKAACLKLVSGGKLEKTPKSVLDWHYKYSGEWNVEKVDGRVSDPPSDTTLRENDFRPSCFAVVELLVLIMPTSAIVERIFSMYEARFNKRQGSILGDRILLELMLGFHNRIL